MTISRIPDPPAHIKDPHIKAYLSDLAKAVRLNVNSLNQGAVFTQSNAGTSLVYNNQNPWITGTGSPEGVVAAPVGALYTDNAGSSGTTLYVKETGTDSNGWIAK